MYHKNIEKSATQILLTTLSVSTNKLQHCFSTKGQNVFVMNGINKSDSQVRPLS